jgi:UDP-N-acetylmuramoyl-tripeptide--D-alanyl-D-alanine ligase
MDIQSIHAKFLECSSFSTDTRQITEGCMFFALKGDKFNANTFAEEALNKGAKFVVIDEPEFKINEQCLLVPDVLMCLQELAKYHRLSFDIPVIGLSGSNGKTTNKELIACVLSKKYKVHATKGNLNNHIGVPLTLLALTKDVEIAIVEMGANHQKEIELLCSIACPSHGFLTNIGKAHLEGFGGIEGVKKGKGELYDYLSKNRGVVFVNNNNVALMEMYSQRSFETSVLYGLQENEISILQDSPLIEFMHYNSKTKFSSHLSGSYNFENMQTAFAIGCFFEVNETAICDAIAAYNPDNNRQQVVEKGSNSVILDAYNANPSSMAASLGNFAKLNTSKSKVVILGDMFELGDESKAEHQILGKMVAESKFETVVLYGENMKSALEFLPNAYYFTDKFSLHNWVSDKNFQESYILIKGSRGVSLETILPFIN